MKKKAVLSNLICLGVTLCLLASMAIFGWAQGKPAPAQPSAPRYGGTLRISDLYDGVSIGYPPKLVRVYSNRQAAPCIETLFRSDKTGKPVPWLATGFTNNVRAKAVTLTLRKGVKFQHGK